MTRNIFKTKLENTEKKHFRLSRYGGYLSIIMIVMTLISICWIFINIMIPANGAISFNNFINVTGFYSVKYLINYSGYQISLTASGIGLIIWSFIYLFFFIITAVSHSSKGKHKKNKDSLEAKPVVNLKKRIPAFINMAVFLFMVTCTFILFVLMLIIPYIGSIVTAHYNYYEVQQAIAQVKENINNYSTWQEVEPIVNRFQNIIGHPYPSLGKDNVNEQSTVSGTLVSWLANYSLPQFFKLTPFYIWSDSIAARWGNSIDGPIVVFSFGLIVYFLGWFSSLLMKRHLQNVETPKEKVSLKEMLNKYKAMQKEKSILRKNRKELLEKENDLLMNLYEIDKDLNTDHQEKHAQLINQEELEEKLSKNHQLKEELEKIAKEKAELKKESLKYNKLKAAFHKAQENSVRSRNKKQEFAVPDAELEEIFKSLDID